MKKQEIIQHIKANGFVIGKQDRGASVWTEDDFYCHAYFLIKTRKEFEERIKDNRYEWEAQPEWLTVKELNWLLKGGQISVEIHSTTAKRLTEFA